MNKPKTHCPAGHPYDKSNTYRASDGAQRCRICMREMNRLRRAAKRARL